MDKIINVAASYLFKCGQRKKWKAFIRGVGESP